LNRARLARFFLDNIGLDAVRLSFGSGAQGGLDQYQDVVGQDLPLLVDGVLKIESRSLTLPILSFILVCLT
jgi:hypothetical protein